jgi:hypothetical protein
MRVGSPMSSTIPRQVTVTRDGKSYRGSYSLKDDVVTVLHTGSDGILRQMSAPTDGLKAIAVARTILRELA